MKFDIVMICPPWKRWNTYRRRPIVLGDQIPPKIGRALEAFEFLEHSLGEFTSPDHMIFVWVTKKHSMDFREYLTRLGYQIRGSIMWVRPKWKSGGAQKTTEFLLIGSKGRIPVLSDEYMNIAESAFAGTVTNKLQKPKDAYELLENEFPRQRKLQLYGWTCRPGWTVFHKNDDKIK
jgi:N6-adenosine-specific RNA methylase IME4